MDSPTDTHRHLSHLIGLYPGYALSSYSESSPSSNYTRKEVLDAVKVSLVHRGNGTGPDADSGVTHMMTFALYADIGRHRMGEDVASGLLGSACRFGAILL